MKRNSLSPLSPHREEWHLDTRRLGRRVLVFDRLESTNTLAAELAAAGAAEGLAVLADEQTAGRGQHGRSWLATPGDAVLLSVLLLPPPALRRPAVLTAWAAVAVATVVEEVAGRPARIKWPNDVLVDRRKVCGILIEQGAGPAGPATVAGIGLNVRQSAAVFAAAGLPDATSLALCSAAAPPTPEVARRLLHRLDEEYNRLCAGDLQTLEDNWRRHLGLLGQPVAAECADGTHRGRLRGLCFDAVELDRPGAGPLVLRPERVLHLHQSSQ
jgi:BirA family biotin operon repressor/biotin-[acetyl-CoA-carboxylase] ligase